MVGTRAVGTPSCPHTVVLVMLGVVRGHPWVCGWGDTAVPRLWCLLWCGS